MVGRLHSVILLTSDLVRQREFYEKRLGLTVANADADRVTFAPQGASLVLLGAAAGAPAEMQLAITARPLEARLEAVRAKGAKVDGDITATPGGRVAVLRDPEGNRIQFVEPAQDHPAGKWPALSYAVVNAKNFEDTLAFYRETLGLKPAEESEFMVVFDTGDTKLVVHDREDKTTLLLHPDQGIAFAFEDADFEVWAEELREAGVTFASAPSEEVFGLQAEVEDGDGWFVVLHGPAPDEEFDETRVSEYEDEYGEEDDDHRGPRKAGGEPPTDPSKKPGANIAKLGRKAAAKSGTKSYEALQKGRDADTGGFQPRARSSFGPPRPFTPRPPGAPGSSGPSRPYTPRPEGSGPSRPYTPRPEGSGPSRPYTPRPEGSPRPGGPSRPPGSGGPSRPFTPRPPRPDRDRS